jgi:GT2 family glycosyltransferase
MRSTPRLSIIITNWNTRELVREALVSILRQPPTVAYEIIVVDNASEDGSAGMIAESFPTVTLIRNNRNEGYAKANNQGATMAKGEMLLLLGSDVLIIDESLQRMFGYLSSRSDVGAVSCRLLNPDRTVQQSCRRFPTLGDAVLTYLSLHGLAGAYNIHNFDFYQTQEVDQPAATSLMIRKSVIDQVGLFDERYTILYNDVDLCKRIHNAGWKVVYLAEAEIIHYGSQSTRMATPGVRLEMYRNILQYYSRHVGRWSGVVLRPILTVRLLLASRSLIAFRLMGPNAGKGMP